MLSAFAAQGQSALRQLESMAGRSISSFSVPDPGPPMLVERDSDSYSSSSSSSSYSSSSYTSSYYELGSVLADGLFNWIDSLIERARENRARKQALKAQGASSRSNATKYTRTSNYKLKDVKPINAGKTLKVESGAAGDYSVYAKYDQKGNPKYGIKDAAGKKWVYKPVSEGIKIVGLHGATVTRDGKTGIVDPVTGKVVEALDYDKYRAFCYPDSPSNMVIALGKTAPDGQEAWQMFHPDADGNYVSDGKTYSRVNFFEDGTGQKIMYQEQGGKVGLLNGKGERILPPVFDDLSSINYTVDNVAYYQASVKTDSGASLKGIVDETGRSIIPCSFDKVDTKSFGSYGIKVESEGKQGVYDVDGYPILPAGFDKVELDHFYDGQKHRAFYRGYTTDGEGRQVSILVDTHGNPLTEFVPGIASSSLIENLASELEEFRI